MVSHLKLTWLVATFGTTFPQTQEKTLENPAHSEEFLAVSSLTPKKQTPSRRSSSVHEKKYCAHICIYVIIYMYTILYIDTYQSSLLRLKYTQTYHTIE